MHPVTTQQNHPPPPSPHPRPPASTNPSPLTMSYYDSIGGALGGPVTPAQPAGTGPWNAAPPPGNYMTMVRGAQPLVSMRQQASYQPADNAYQAAMIASGAIATSQDEQTVVCSVIAHDMRREFHRATPGAGNLANRIIAGMPHFVHVEALNTMISRHHTSIYSLPEINRYLANMCSEMSLEHNTRCARSIERSFNPIGINSTVSGPTFAATRDRGRPAVMEISGVTKKCADIFSVSDAWFNRASENAVAGDVGYRRRMARAATSMHVGTGLYLILMPTTYAFLMGLTNNPYPTLAALYRFALESSGMVIEGDPTAREFIDGMDNYDTWDTTPFATIVGGRIDRAGGAAVAAVAAAAGGAVRRREEVDILVDARGREAPAARRRADRNNNDVVYAFVPFACHGARPVPSDFMVSSFVGAPEARVYQVGTFSLDQRFAVGSMVMDTSAEVLPSTVRSAVLDYREFNLDAINQIPLVPAILTARVD